MKVALLSASVSRQAGGMFWALRSLAQSVSEAGCEVRVLSGRDADSAADLSDWRRADVTVLTRRGPSSFGYLPELSAVLRRANAHLLHTHGLWMYPSVASRQWRKVSRRPLVISPHGMLDPWALRHSPWKKRIAALLYENAHLRSAACLHALCAAEHQAIRAYGLTNPVAVIPNGVDLPDLNLDPPAPDWGCGVPAGSRVLLFLGRLHPKKGLVNLVHAWAKVRQQASTMSESWFLIIAGWDQGSHEAELRELADALDLGGSVRFVGPQFGEEKAGSLRRADAFVLPSFSEGLPMAVLEAWSYRLPVVMTAGCNLPEGFCAGAALETGTEPTSIAAALRKLFALSHTERQAMGERGRALVEARFNWPKVAEQMVAVYAWVLGNGPRPDCVITD